MEYKDYYKIMGVDRNASEKDIKLAYRRLAKKYHPDVNKTDKTAEEKFKEINEAYEVLSDKEKRARYDEFGAEWKDGGSQGFRTHPGGYSTFHFDPGDLGSAFHGSNTTGFSDFFNMLFGSGAGRRTLWEDISTEDLLGEELAGSPADMEFPLELTLEEAYHGAAKMLELQKEEACSKCSGRGKLGNALCSLCRGNGTVLKPRRIEVKIPRGVRDGSKIRIQGEGRTIRRQKGDLYLNIKLRKHPIFEVKGGDLYSEVPVDLTDAVLGAEVKVPTMRGKATMKIPPETQNGKTFRLAGEGLPAFGKNPAGNLFAKIIVKMPTGLTSKEKKLFEKLAEIGKSRSGRESNV